MGKFKPRTNTKGKRWAKGQSSSCNPETRKFRNAAKTRFFQPNIGTSSNLTVAALKKLDAFSSGKVEAPTESDQRSEHESVVSGSTFKTFKTFASDWSTCSNASFHKLMKNFTFNSALHKEMLAVLAAVTEVIRSNGGSETNTEYFAALMSTLDASDTEDCIAAILSLLSMGIKSVSSDVLRSKFSECSKTFMDLLVKFSTSDNNVILRTVIGCLSVLLRAQDAGVWSNSSTENIFHSLLAFTIHSKPKVRKAAQHAICAILKGSTFISDTQTHPGAVAAAKFCCHQIETNTKLTGSTTTLHVLGLLKDIINTFPRTQMKSACETILKVMTLSNVLVNSCSLQALHGLFTSRPSEQRLTPQLNAQLINALYDYQPAVNDSQPTIAWLTVMQEAFCNLARIDAELCCVNLTKLYSVVTRMWLCDNIKVINSATLTLRTVTMDCLDKCKQAKCYHVTSRKLFTIVEDGLAYQYHNSWAQVLHLLSTLFEIIGADGKLYMAKCIKSLSDLRDSHNFTYSNELDFALGKAVRCLGPEYVLESSPFHIPSQENDYDFKKSWLLPILKDNIRSSSLKFFIGYFLPIAKVCGDRAQLLSSRSDKIGSHLYDLVQCQIWSLLPSFCHSPSDVKENFKLIAKTLGVVISERKDLRHSAMSALRKLITNSVENNNVENVKEMKKYAKNYLPVLFSVYTIKPNGTDEEGQRFAALETIRVYLTISDSTLNGELFDKAVLRLKDTPELETFLKESVMDLLTVLLPYQDQDRLGLLYSFCLDSLKKSHEQKEQKKCYRMLETLCKAESANCQQFIEGKSSELLNFLLKHLTNTNLTSKGARLRCFLYIVRLLSKKNCHLIKEIVPEAVLCCRDINKRCRASAYELLEEMYSVYQKHSSQTNDDVIRDYFGLMLVGLTSSPSVISSTILALANMTYRLREEIPPDLIQILLENVFLLSAVPTREVVSSCLSFIMLALTSFKYEHILRFVPALVKALVSMTNDCKQHFRRKTRDILSRLIRKFTYETIQQLVPQSETVMHKRLRNLKKLQERKKRLREESKTNMSEDGGGDYDDDGVTSQFSLKKSPKTIEEILASSDDESDKDDVSDIRSAKSFKSQRSQKNKLQKFIKESGEEIVDLMSPAASTKISVSRPTDKKDVAVKKKKDGGFKTSSDGRLIITDNTDDEEDDDDGKNKINFDSDLSESDGEEDTKTVRSRLSRVEIGRKRRMSGSTIEPPLKYRAGGSGIHRPVGKQKKRGKSSDMKSGAEYKAKKARGDLKLKGKPDPYAYIPLSRKILNKRKKLKQATQFKSVVKSAKKGVKIGNKLKRKLRK